MRRNMGGGGGPGGGGGGPGGGGGGPAAAGRRSGRAGPVNQPSDGEPIVRLVDVKKQYVMGHAPAAAGACSRGRRGEHTITVHAMRGVSVEFYQGEYVAIMGTSGSGKSTMLNLLGCLDRPSSGQYLLGGRDVASSTTTSCPRSGAATSASSSSRTT